MITTGSGNVFADLNLPNADALLARANESRDFRHRCYGLDVGRCFHWRGVTVKRVGKDKFLAAGRKGNWLQAFDAMTEGAGAPIHRRTARRDRRAP